MKKGKEQTQPENRGKIAYFWYRIRRPLTIMLAPHDDSKVLSFRVSLVSLWFFGLLFLFLLVGVISFSAFNYRMGEQLGQMQGSLTQMTAGHNELRGAIQTLPVLTEMLQDTVASIGQSSNVDFSGGRYGVHQVQGDILDRGIMAVGQGGVNDDLASVEQFVGVIENLIPMVATIGEMFDSQQRFLAEIPTSWPVIGNRGFITLLFGPGRDPFTDGWQFHTGVDIAYSMGTPVLVSADGVVVQTSYNPRGFGNVVLVRHGYGFYTRYAHMQRFIVTEGQRVRQGEQLGLMGATGRATGSHVHFEVLLGTEVVDPMRYLSIVNSSFARFIRDRG